MAELEKIYFAYKDAETWIENADQKIKEIEDKFGNKDVIKSVYEHNRLMKVIASNLANFFEEMEEDGSGNYQEIIPPEEIKKYLEGTILVG